MAQVEARFPHPAVPATFSRREKAMSAPDSFHGGGRGARPARVRGLTSFKYRIHPSPGRLPPMLLTEEADRTRASFIDRIGLYPPLAWGYVGLLVFMIGDGVESGYLSRYLVD